MTTQRLRYPDICKCFSIFLVTCSHSAQSVSGQTWTNFWGGTSFDLAFTMPLFFLISGWFIDIDKIRQTNIINYAIGKARRLIVPALTWFVLFVLASGTMPCRSGLSQYWYLTALFASLCNIGLFTKIFKNNLVCIVASLFFVLVCPFTTRYNINFMFPFLWGGVILRKLYNNKRLADILCVVFCVISVILSFFWNYK